MSTEDRGRSFGIFYTQNKIKCVNNEIGMNIMDIIDKNDLTLAEVSRKLKLPMSTVLFNINKLEEKKLIGTYEDENDRRKIHYAKVSIKMITSTEPRPEFQEATKKMLVNTPTNNPLFYKYLMGFVNSDAIRMGLNIDPLMERAGWLIGNSIKAKFENQTIDYVIEYLKNYFKISNGPNLSLLPHSPTKIKIIFDFDLPNDSNMVFTAIGLVCSAIEHCTGVPHIVTESKTMENHHSLLFQIEPNNKNKRNLASLYTDDRFTKMENDSLTDDFCIIIDRDGYPRMIDNPSQIKIINRLEAEPDTFKGLSEKLGGPQSTIFSNLTKLENLGIVHVNRNSPGSNTYTNYGLKIMSKKNNSNINLGLVKNMIEKSAGPPELYYRFVFQYLLMALDAASIDTGNIQNCIGRTYGSIILKRSNNINADQIIIKLCEEEKGIYSTLTLKSYIPLTLTLECTLFTDVGCCALLQFYIGEISEIIIQKTGIKYAPTSITNIKKEGGVQSYQFVMEPVRK
jgi:DNA-binding MarR family transcriptional regulator